MDGTSSKRLALALALGVTLGLVAILGTTRNAGAASDIGGLDLNRYCVSKYSANNYFNYSATGWVILEQQNAGGWRCEQRTIYVQYNVGSYNTQRFSNSYRYGIDMNDACRWQYGGSAWAQARNWNDPYSWRCYR